MPTNHKPHAIADFAAAQGGVAVTIDAVANDTDRDGDTLSLSGIGKAPHHGTLSILDGSLLYTPDADWHGKDRFTYRIDDGHGGTATGKVSVTVADSSHASGGGAEGQVFTSTAADDHWTGTSGKDTFNLHLASEETDPSHKLIDLGHDTITGFESGHDVIDYQVAFGLNGQECYLNSQDLIGTLDTNRDGILSAADGGGVSVHGNDITLDLGITIAGNGDPGPANEVAFKGDVTVLGHQSLTAADLGTVAPWTHETAHLVHAGHETLVA